MKASQIGLPAGVLLLERGWLSSNNVVLLGQEEAAVIDSGYWTHSAQTVRLLEQAVAGRRLTTLVNTHLHSDHCGGNAALQARDPALRTLIPPGLAPAVRRWDPEALTYVPTGQQCPRFSFEGVLQPGSSLCLGDKAWEIHAAPGHDPHSVILFEPRSRTLVSADALWENGFGIVFPELEGVHAFTEVAATLDVIEKLQPLVVLPGHGSAFTGVDAALARARGRLSAYVSDPRRHATHAAKVLLKFKLLEIQQTPVDEFLTWAENTPYLRMLRDRFHPESGQREWVASLLTVMAGSGAVRMQSGVLQNA